MAPVVGVGVGEARINESKRLKVTTAIVMFQIHKKPPRMPQVCCGHTVNSPVNSLIKKYAVKDER